MPEVVGELPRSDEKWGKKELSKYKSLAIFIQGLQSDCNQNLLAVLK